MADTEMSGGPYESNSPDAERSTASNTNAHPTSAATNSPAPAISEKSPSPEDAAKFEKDLAVLNEAIKSAPPDVARAAVRRNWRKCITGSVHDESFFVRAVFKYCTDHIFKRSLEEYADKFLHVATPEFLDQAMEMRLSTIGAKDLVAILAKTKRLGYDERDIVDENDEVMPAEDESDSEPEEVPPPPQEAPLPARQPSPPPPRPAFNHDQALQTEQMNIAAAAMASLSNQANLPSRRKPNGTSSTSKVCPACGASFAQSAGLKYHTDNKVCQKPPRGAPASANATRFQCPNCGKTFTNPGGFKYHTENKVCGNHERAAPTSPDRPHPQEYPAVLSHPLPPIASVAFQPAPPIGSQVLQHGPYAAGPPPLMQPPPIMPLGRGPYNFHPNPPLQAQPSAPPMLPLVKTPTSQSPAALSPARQEEMNAKLANEQFRLDKELSEVPENITSVDRKEMVDKIKRNSATRKSIIRRSYGVQMRKSKIAPANAVTTPEGGIELLGSSTPSSASGHSADPAGPGGFQPINRLDAFRAPQPVLGPAPVGPAPVGPAHPSILSHPHPISPVSGPDAKRRRVNDQNGPPPISPFFGHPNHTPPVLRTEVENQRGPALEWKAYDPVRSNASPPSEYANIAPKAPVTKVPIGGPEKEWESQPAKPSSSPNTKPESPPAPSTRTPLKSSPVLITSNTEAVEISSNSTVGSDSDEEIPAKRPTLNQSSGTSSGSPVASLKVLNGHGPTRQLRNGSKTIAEVAKAKRVSKSS